MKYLINIGNYKVYKKETINTSNNQFTMYFDDVNEACAFAIEKAREFYIPSFYNGMSFSEWSDPRGDQSYLWCHAKRKYFDTVWGVMVDVWRKE
jgi:hypothetical protein